MKMYRGERTAKVRTQKSSFLYYGEKNGKARCSYYGEQKSAFSLVHNRLTKERRMNAFLLRKIARSLPWRTKKERVFGKFPSN
jgi:hypothetical protein